MTTKTTIALTAIICLLVGGAAGYAGATKFRFALGGRGQRMGNFQFTGGQNGPGGFRGMPGQNGQMFGGGRVIGSVQSVVDGRLTIQTPNNSSQIVLINGSTTFQKMTSGSASDVTNGTQVVVMGQQNPDGSTTATSIQIIPEGMNFPFGGRQGGAQQNANQ